MLSLLIALLFDVLLAVACLAYRDARRATFQTRKPPSAKVLR